MIDRLAAMRKEWRICARRLMLTQRRARQDARGIAISQHRLSAPLDIIMNTRPTFIFTRVPRKPRHSTRGERGETWRTKRWTEARHPFKQQERH